MQSRRRGATSHSSDIEHNPYRMSPLIDRVLVLYASFALITTQTNSVHAKPMSSASQQSTRPEASASPQHEPIRAIHYHFDQKMDPTLQLFKFNSSSSSVDYTGQQTDSGNTNDHTTRKQATCNDGSPAGYYKRLNNHSKSWIIYLQGGGFCGSEEACQYRWRQSGHLMTSNYWPESISVEGILSSEPKDNPYLWNANHIYVPYCSSDSWTGQQEARTDQSPMSSFAFMGSRIIEKVLESLFEDLPRESSLLEAKFILLAGDSAGATGVMMNLDKVNRFVQQRFINGGGGTGSVRPCTPDNPLLLCEQRQVVPIVRGIADSGWFLDNEPYDIHQQQQQQQQHSQSATSGEAGGTMQSSLMIESAQPVECGRQRCSPLQSIRQAMIHWNGQVPAACATRHPNEPWRCYFGYRAYTSLKTPLFVVQWLYDEAQLMVDNIIRPGTNSQWNYVNKLVSEMRASLENVTALFAPSCLSHSLIIKQSWNQININGYKLPHILNSWEEETLVGQPTFDLLVQDEQQQQLYQQQQQLLTGIASSMQHQQQQQQQSIVNGNQVVPVTRDQHFDRWVAPQPQHQFELRSALPQGHRSYSSSSTSAPTATATATTTTANNSRARSRKKKRNNQQSSSRINAINSNRLSRSTVVEDSTVMFNNNVPDLVVLSTSRQQETSYERFRLIDTCGWPQCNRDCPNLDLDFNFRPMLSY